MTTTWTLTAGQALQRAYLLLGVLTAPDYALTPFQVTQGLTVMNGVLQAMQTAGSNVFRQTPTALVVSAGIPTVPIPNDVVGIEEARWVVSSSPLYERPLGRFQWIDYMQLPTKNASGPPTIFMFDYQVDSTQLYVWPVTPIPGTINCTVSRRAADSLTQSAAIDLPKEWMLGFTYMLADALMDDQGLAEMDPATAQRVAGHAKYWKDQLENFDRPTSVFFRAYGQPNSPRLRRY